VYSATVRIFWPTVAKSRQLLLLLLIVAGFVDNCNSRKLNWNEMTSSIQLHLFACSRLQKRR
jgi:hypothetical protein